MSIDKAIEGADFVVHTASPFPPAVPKNENEIIEPAVNGTKAVMEACHKHKVKWVVITSSVVAVFDPERATTQDIFNESDWLNITKKTPPYDKSKFLAEKAAWDYQAKLPENEKFDIVTINPGFIIGPVLVKSPFTSEEIIWKFMLGKFPGLPKMNMALVDVRSCAVAHLKALTCTPNKWFLLVSETPKFVEIGKMLHKTYG